MGERRGTKALELWCRRITNGYPGVNVQNMTTSWKDGLAFCAMIHHFRSDLIDFDSLNKNDVYGNNELAFRTAEQHLGIPALLDAEDMASCTVPDRLSILTYLSQFYQTFGGSSPSRLATNRTTETADERIAPVPESPKQKVGSRLGMRRDPCIACGLPVFLAEKLLIARAPYHRTCFRCARCSNQLTPGNYYETEEGQYCCETCPDEEKSASMRRKYTESTETSDAEREKNKLSRSPLSDEEKTERKVVRNLLLENVAMPDLISHTSQMRKSFMASHLLSEKISEPTVKTKNDVTIDSEYHEADSRIDSAFPDDDENEEREYEEEGDSRGSTSDSFEAEESNVERYDVHSALGSLDIRSDEDRLSTAILSHDTDKNREENTKELSRCIDELANSEANLSLVQKRLRMFEISDKAGERADGKDRSKYTSRTKRVIESSVSQPAAMARNRSLDLASNVSRMNDEERAESSKIKNGGNSANVDREREEDSAITEVDGCKRSETDIPMSNAEHLNDAQRETSLTVKNAERQEEEVAGKRQRGDEEEPFETAVENNLPIAKSIDLSASEDYPEDLNPFKNNEEDNVVEDGQRTVRDSSKSDKTSTNPFDSDEDVEETELPKPAARSKPEKDRELVTSAPTRRLLTAPQINLNPFLSDEEDERDSDLEGRDKTPQGSVPVPKPRTIKTTPEVSVSQRVNLNRGDVYASNSSITSSESTTTGYRKKKPAPQPPAVKELFPSDDFSSPVTLKSYNDTSSLHRSSSPRTTPRARKTKPAPPPPMPTSTPCNTSIDNALSFDESSINELADLSDDHSLDTWQDEKINKDETNRNRQSLSNVSCVDDLSSYTDKSVQGKWKRKKGPAPPRPIPHKRKIKVISMKDVKLELDEIELQQQGLERQGVRLEQLIRDKCESRPRTEDSSLDTDVEELVLELFALVNEKNELFRRQAELMLLRRQQRLEEEHAEVEYQIRCLMCQPEATKTDFDKQKEEVLIQRLVEIVERRNEIVECLEMDRRREVEEDKSINKHMGLYVARSKNELLGNDNDSSKIAKTGKRGKIKERLREKKLKKVTKKDADKDVDETEVKLKRHNKRRWF